MSLYHGFFVCFQYLFVDFCHLYASVFLLFKIKESWVLSPESWVLSPEIETQPFGGHMWSIDRKTCHKHVTNSDPKVVDVDLWIWSILVKFVQKLSFNKCEYPTVHLCHIPQRTIHNRMCTFLFLIVACGISDWCIVGFGNLACFSEAFNKSEYPIMHLSHIPQCSIQNRNLPMSVLNVALWDIGLVHRGICVFGRFQ